MPSTKKHLQGLFRSIGVYERLRASWIYDFYWRIADRRMVDDKHKEIGFYRNLLVGFRRGDLILDIGANYGNKTEIFLRLGARVAAVEPDETCQAVLKEKFHKYRVRQKPVSIVAKAVSDENSTRTMWVDTPGSALNTLSEKWAETLRSDDLRFGQKLGFGQWKKVETISVDQLIADYGVPFFVKIDVEGHELSVLRGMQRAVPYLSFEVNLPEFRVEGLECVRLLGNLADDGKFNYTNDCRRGLLLNNWVAADEFTTVLASCAERSIEVFWKTPRLGRS
jgi:FkbM family methyltransferase